MDRGFFSSLFDFSFSSFVTVRLIKVIYALFIAGSGFFALLFVVTAFARSTLFGLFVLLIGAPVIFFLYVILARVYLELVVAIFRIAENTSILTGQGRSLSGPPPSSPGGPPPPPSSPGGPPPPPPPPPHDGPPPPPPPPPHDGPPPPPPHDVPPPPPPAPPTVEVEAPPEEPPPPLLRPRRRVPLRPRRATSEPPPQPPA